MIGRVKSFFQDRMGMLHAAEVEPPVMACRLDTRREVEPKTYGDIAGRLLLRSLKHRMEEEAKAPPKPFVPIIPEPQATEYRRELIAKALYDHWTEEDFTNEYAPWSLLIGKDIWYSRADAVIAADPKE